MSSVPSATTARTWHTGPGKRIVIDTLENAENKLVFDPGVTADDVSFSPSEDGSALIVKVNNVEVASIRNWNFGGSSEGPALQPIQKFQLSTGETLFANQASFMVSLSMSPLSSNAQSALSQFANRWLKPVTAADGSISVNKVADNLVFAPLTFNRAASGTTTLTYSFLTSSADSELSRRTDYDLLMMTAAPSDLAEDPENFYSSVGELSASERQAAVAAMNRWAEVANVEFKEVTGNNGMNGDIIFGYTSWDIAASFPVLNRDGSYSDKKFVWIGADVRAEGQSTDTAESLMFNSTFDHEIGHALGLQHPGDYHSYAHLVDGQSWYNQDNNSYTTMSYSEINEDNPQLPSYSYPFLGIHDIAAIQRAYGANMAYNAEDTVYRWRDREFFHQAIWDAGGVDTIDASNQSTNVQIDLREGRFSSVGSGFSGSPAVNNLSIAYNAVIENARGGNGNDTIHGNESNNRLYGNSGQDTIHGNAGNDWIRGGLHRDTLYGDAGNDELYGGGGWDTLYGGDGDDILSGGGGRDFMEGGAGNDTLTGGAGNDTYRFGRGGGRDMVDNRGRSGDNDVIQFDENVIDTQVWFRREGDNLRLDIVGTDDSISIKDWFVGTDNRLDFQDGAGGIIKANQIDAMVNAMASFAPPSDGLTTIPDTIIRQLEAALSTPSPT